MQEITKKVEISGFLGRFMLALAHNFERIRIFSNQLELKVDQNAFF